jgi:hypothetical protein
MNQATNHADRMHISKGICGGFHVCDVAAPLKHAGAENWEVETKERRVADQNLPVSKPHPSVVG